MNNKIFISIIVTIIVFLIAFISYKAFLFEPNKEIEKGIPNITDEYIKELYNYIPSDNYNTRYSIYNGYYTTYNNLSSEVYMSMLFNYLNYAKKSDLLIADDAKDIENYKPLYKISINNIKDIYINMFDKSDIKLSNFYYDKYYGIIENNLLYIYEKKVEDNEYLVKRIYDSYAVADNQNTINIYEYFVKCKKDDNLCYNDDRLTMINNKVKLENNNIIYANKEDLVKYKHVYKLNNNHYYWYSSEIIEN